MTTEQMRYFLEAARLLNFTAAAEALYITQPTLSRQIMNMEKELGTQLFVRHNNTVTLTEAGQTLYAGVRPIYDGYCELSDRVRNMGQGITGILRVGVMEDQLLDGVLAAAVNRFNQQHRNVSITVNRMSINAIRQRLIEGTLDIGDVMKTKNEEFQMMTVLRQSEDPAMFACSRALLDAPPETYSPEDCLYLLKKHPLLLPDRANFGEAENDNPVERWIEAVGIRNLQPTVQFVGNILDLPLHISAGLGVTVVNAHNLLRIDPTVALIPFPVHQAYDRIVVCHPENENPLLPGFLAVMREVEMHWR